MDVYKGTGAFSGIAIGKILYYHKSEYQMRQYEITDVKTELNIFRQARYEIEAKLCWYMYRLKIGNMNGVSKYISEGEGPESLSIARETLG